MSFRMEPRTVDEQLQDVQRRLRAVETARAVTAGLPVEDLVVETASTTSSTAPGDLELLAWIAVGMGG